MAYHKCIRVLATGTIGAALWCLLSVYIADAHNGFILEMGAADVLPPSSRQKYGVIRRLHEGEPVRNTLRLPLIHRHELMSHHFATAGERITDFIRRDQLRVMGFSAPSPSHRPSSPSERPASRMSVKKDQEFKGKIISGAAFPGNIGQYFAEFSMGTPGQRILFITDTGSDLIWVHCASQLKKSSSPSFLPKASSTFIPITCSSQECNLVPPPLGATCNGRSPTNCTYAYAYSDLSQTTGTFAYDTIAMRPSSRSSPTKIKNVAFGCGTNNTGPSISKVGGVMGLGQGPLSFSSQVGQIYGNKFSYCFTSFFHRKLRSTLVFGDDPAGINLKSRLQYTPFVPNPIVDTFYHLQIEEMKLDKEHLPINSSLFEIDEQGNGGVVIDSGTTLTFFLKPAYDVILQAFKKKVHYPLTQPTAGLHLCYNVSKIAKPRFPRISIIFKGGAKFRPPSRNYFLSPTHGIKCLGVMGSSGLSVLGNLIQQNYYVEYDRLKNRLAFAKANCSISL